MNKFLNRELSWLDFNYRVLDEAYDRNNPLLERFKFLAITSSNLDEFFMVRMAGLKEQTKAGLTTKDLAGMTATEQLQAAGEVCHNMFKRQDNCLHRSLLPELCRNNISFIKIEDWNDDIKKHAGKYFESVLYPILTPFAVDTSRPFPLLANKSLNLCVKLKKHKKTLFAIVRVPKNVSRTKKLPASISGNEDVFLYIEDIIKSNLAVLFEGCKIMSASTFRVTKDADLSIDEEAEDLLVEIEKSIKKRKWGAPVRLEVEPSIDKEILKFLQTSMDFHKSEIYKCQAPLDKTFFFEFISNFNDRPEFFYEPKPPLPSIDFFNREDDIFSVIREKDCLVHHPYESFDCVVKFVRQAANDPKVLAIKQTLYRVSGNSPIIASLVKAAENGKQVTVMVELKARFDEENNIIWAKKLEQAGCHVVYGLVGLKTHCKVCLVVRREDDGIRRYLHLGTGNYNDKTAKLYTDIGMFTCKKSYGSDGSALFNLLTGYAMPPKWKKFAVAPKSLHKHFYKQIDNEIENAKAGRPAKIIAKINSLVDKGMIEKLYSAGNAGVEIILIVRGICTLVPGYPEACGNIKVYSIIGRYLEHSRIFYFHNNNSPKLFMGSADWMTRNLHRRIEVVFPVEDEHLKKRVIQILEIAQNDTLKMRYQLDDGSYKYLDKRGKQPLVSQDEYYEDILHRYNKKYESIKFKPIQNLLTK